MLPILAGEAVNTEFWSETGLAGGVVGGGHGGECCWSSTVESLAGSLEPAA